jgi:hypothetical protein
MKKILRFSYSNNPDGTWTEKRELVDFPADEHQVRVEKLAEAQPGRVAVGAQAKKDDVTVVEIERYLDECTGEGT